MVTDLERILGRTPRQGGSVPRGTVFSVQALFPVQSLNPENPSFFLARLGRVAQDIRQRSAAIEATQLLGQVPDLSLVHARS
jgi:hypothetical protein